MRILHVSDLHIGCHNATLLESLKTRARVLKPDVIVATGDFADAPDERTLTEARDYLLKLVKLCPKRSHGPPLIVVPGNHDVAHFKGTWGLFGSAANYFAIFADLPTSGFYQTERVWIYGFNSAREKGVGANGAISQDDLNAFDHAYEEAKEKHKQNFENAYKIVALHHHPLPIRYSSKYSRWVTLLNAAEFLEQMLKHNVDLVIHGHEHVHAQARFAKRINECDRSLTVVSAGTVFHRDPGDDHNRFNLIQIAADGAVDIESYEAKGGTFDAEPIDRYVARGTVESDLRRFNEIVTEKGYKYQRVIARTNINPDGDAERSVEFWGLALENAKSERARRHHISLPQTSGYIDVATAWEILDDDKARQLTFTRMDEAAGDKRVNGIIEYGRTLQRGMPLSLRCQWWAVNAMAMSRGQSLQKYSDLRFEEYTHFPILDPVEQLMCMLYFPPGFSPARPEPFVAKVTDQPGVGLVVDERDAAMEYKLRGSLVMDGKAAEGLRATLQIERPSIGYTYGFRWTLPDVNEPDGGTFEGETAEVVEALLQFRRTKNADQLKRLKIAIGLAGEFVREKCAPKFSGRLEYSLIVLDSNERKMFNVVACRLRGAQFEWIDFDRLIFEYGEGIAGKAFKTKMCRVYTHLDSRLNYSGPDYYRKVEGDPGYKVLLALPIYHPKSETNVYAVLTCGSFQKSCPLRELGGNGVPVAGAAVKATQLAVSRGLYDDLTKIFNT